jgi:transketolase
VEKIATREAYGEALVELGKEDPSIVVLDADLSGSTKTSLFAKAFPDRFFNLGVAEQNLMGVAAGFARAGLKPFVSTFAIFATGRAFEPLRQQIAYPRLNVKIVASHGGITVGEDGGSHQTVEDLSLMRSLPNMVVVVPADGVETKKVIRAVHLYEGPVYVRTGRMKVPVLFDSSYSFHLGKGNLLREGDDLTIVACGVTVFYALQAWEELRKEGISVRLINMATLKPIDRDLIEESAIRTGAILTVEEHSIIGGLGSAVAEVVGETYPVPVHRWGILDTFGESGKGEELLEYFRLTTPHIVEQAKYLLEKKEKFRFSHSYKNVISRTG